MTKIEVLRHILDETYILLSALDAEDLDIIQTALDNRGEWINRYDRADDPSNAEADTLKQMQQAYRTAHNESMERLETFRAALTEAQNRNRAAQNEADKTKRIHEQYAQSGEVSGLTVDRKQ